ncbi:hypothetical protein SPRG_14707 [Saprolegnia parasitica CBS 223.65]|uniref:CREG-like beta-barrel domain-containing protein n=1 Tax=Saprolegnia parasitica (strain CBS 223.65) TaxID=695850 RepID=A0A067BR91_SAPPC|nr:hypothetical protein SPRG_14707 [Saprolegnia parasitica CBS 223.65]KDO19315.1 hypothetical protein SPRG_14707 [Saprolegnia parasitica CBS 223.65]|eukprot:XP_012209989.1 hypothetical protein SPRG_14707 [Saprolegnia parasitica CBS 223.65]
MSERLAMLPSAPAPRRHGFVAGLLAGAVGVFCVGLVLSQATPRVDVEGVTTTLSSSPSLSALAGVSAADLALINTPLDAASNLTEEAWISARIARWIVHANTWGTIATTSVHLDGAPFASMISYSDGVGASPRNATGRLYFYSSVMGSTGKDLAANPRASVSITMAQLGHCAYDPQDPTCWRVVFSGTLTPAVAVDDALAALFSKHPQMSYWPRGHDFTAYEMHPTEILLLDFYGGAKHIDPATYYSVRF